MASDPFQEIDELRRAVARMGRHAHVTRNAWMRAAEKALAAIPGASNSSHPAYDLWLRAELAKAPPVGVVLSTQPQDPSHDS